MTSEAPAPVQGPVEIDANKVIAILQESHPDAVRYAAWRVRAEEAEARLAQQVNGQPAAN